MEKNKAKNLAQELLDFEFAEVNNNPLGYCLSMGWDKNSNSTKKAIKKKNQLAPNADDIKNLTSIIESCNTENVLEVMESSNTVSDFICNCVASHIIA